MKSNILNYNDMKLNTVFFIILVLLCFMSTGPNYGQSNPVISADDSVTAEVYNAVPEPSTTGEAYTAMPQTFTPFNSFEFLLALITIIAGLSVLIIEYILIKSDRIKNEQAVRVIIVTLVIFGALFLVAAGYNNNQIAPIIGLLGTIAGYMLNGSGSK